MVDHLLLHCSFAMGDLVHSFWPFGVYWVMPRSILELMECWWAALGRIETFRFGKLSPIVCCGVFGESLTGVVLRIVNDRM